MTKLSLLRWYHLDRQELSAGDVIRINRNEAALNLTNGDRMRVDGIHGGVVKLSRLGEEGGPRTLELLSNKPLHLELAYTSTVHSSQRLTADRTFICLDTQSRTTSMNLYYVVIH
jgi:ATP-dependent exoDNAse (exonuclease V) alpha subunit